MVESANYNDLQILQYFPFLTTIYKNVKIFHFWEPITLKNFRSIRSRNAPRNQTSELLYSTK